MSGKWLYYQIHGVKPARSPRRRPTGRCPARSWKYRGWVRTLPSAISGLEGCEAAHTGTDGGMKQKASDYSCIPLTPEEHREYHQIGKAEFEAKYGIDCATLVKRLNHDWFAYRSLVK
jgi:Protein of unknown function (DUF968)